MKPLTYQRALDGIRGLAVLLVVVSHQTVCLPKSTIEQIWISTLRFGWVGVDLFFVLSGFLITTILLEARQEQHYYRNFYGRRALRIVPLYYTLLALFFLVVPRLPSHLVRFLEPLEHSQWWFWGFMTNFLLALRGSSVQPPIAVSWSLSIEEQFYLFWPFIVRRFGFEGLRATCFFLILVAEFTRILMGINNMPPLSIYVLPFTRADTLAMGALLALYRFYHPELVRNFMAKAKGVLPTSVFIGVGLAIYPGKESLWMYSLGFLSIAIGSVLLILYTLEPGTGIQKFFANRFLVSIGKRSFAMYLIHVPVIGLLVTLFADPNEIHEPLKRVLTQAALHLGGFVITWLLATCAYHAIERHFLRLKRIFVPNRDLFGGAFKHFKRRHA